MEGCLADEQKVVAEVHIVAVDIGTGSIDAGSRCVLVGAAEAAVAGTVAGTVALTEVADTVVLLVGLVELADTAASVGLAVVVDNDGLDTVDYADIVAQGSLVEVADTGIAVSDIVDSADTAGVAGTVGLAGTAEIADIVESAADTADVVGATERQPYLTAVTHGCHTNILFLSRAKKVKDLPEIMKPSAEI